MPEHHDAVVGDMNEEAGEPKASQCPVAHGRAPHPPRAAATAAGGPST